RGLQNGGSTHAVLDDLGAGPSTLGDRLAASGGAGDQSPLGRGHGDVELLAVDQQRSGDPAGDGHDTDDILTALSVDGLVVVAEPGRGEVRQALAGAALDDLPADTDRSLQVALGGLLDRMELDLAAEDSLDELIFLMLLLLLPA